MRVQDVENFYRRLEAEPDPEQVSRKSELHYLAVLAAIANGRADPDPVSLAKAVLRGVAGPAPGRQDHRDQGPAFRCAAHWGPPQAGLWAGGGAAAGLGGGVADARAAAGECQAPEVRYVQSSDQAISGDEIH